MAELERRDMQANVFPNKKKELDWHADYRGDILEEDQDYYIDITKKTAKTGNTFWSVKLKPKETLAKESISNSFDDIEI